MNMQVEEADAIELVSLLRESLCDLSGGQLESVHAYDKTKEALVISFDVNWVAFIGYTRGYNKPGKRIKFKRTPSVIEHIKDIYKRHRYDRMQGGRLFINNSSAYSHDSFDWTVCHLSWPDDFDILAEVRALLYSLSRH